MIKKNVEQLLESALQTLKKTLPFSLSEPVYIEYTRDKQHGDFASNIAFSLSKQLRIPPRELAEKIIAVLPTAAFLEKVEIAGSGFINFFLTPEIWKDVIKEIVKQGKAYGSTTLGKNKKILVEFVSSNPTGPLHVGHGRAAAYGDAVCHLLETVGYQVYREYYVNDGGRQMDILSTSVWLRYLKTYGETFSFPSNGYQGLYVTRIAEQLKKEYGDQFFYSANDVFQDLPLDEPAGGDKEIYIDALIKKAKTLLSADNYQLIFKVALAKSLGDIQQNLTEFHIHFQHWFFESTLIKNGAVDSVITRLKSSNYIYERDGATWFKSTAFGDDKDRVLIRENGQFTYFAADAAYHLNKLERGFDHLINIVGADHHGYLPRIRGVIEALIGQPAPLTMLFTQLTALYRGKKRIRMSTRKGTFITLRKLCKEVGIDATRFFYILRKAEQCLDFDIELASSKTNDNPFYYVQYAHARICSVMRQAAEKNIMWDEEIALQSLSCLVEATELHLLKSLNRYTMTVEQAAIHYSPHLLAHYLCDIAQIFHAYYNSHTFLVNDISLCQARLALIMATKQVIMNAFYLLGVTPLEIM